MEVAEWLCNILGPAGQTIEYRFLALPRWPLFGRFIHFYGESVILALKTETQVPSSGTENDCFKSRQCKNNYNKCVCCPICFCFIFPDLHFPLHFLLPVLVHRFLVPLCLLHTHASAAPLKPQRRNEGSLWFLQYNPPRSPGDNEVLVCLKLEQIISVGGGCLITNDQIFFFFFFLATP